MKLYDLAMADSDVRPSPWCWIAKFALLHKGVEFESVPMRFTEKETYPDPEHAQLPILVTDEGETICDSAAIIAWLEKNIAGNPLTQTSAERAAADFFLAWLGATVFPALAPPLMIRIWEGVDERDKEYFRTSREKRFGKTLEELAGTPGVKQKMEEALKTLAAPLARQKFLGGDAPNLCDYMVMSVLMWKRLVSSAELFEMPQAVDAWHERMLDLFDGYARKAKAAG